MTTPLIDLSALRFYCDGRLSPVRLDHPEGVAVQVDGTVWCGGEEGQIYRIAQDGGPAEIVHVHSHGFILGLAFAPDGMLWYADYANRAVHRLDPTTGLAETVIANEIDGHPLRLPNALAFAADGTLYLSDSHGESDGPGIFRRTPEGTWSLWHDGPFAFANGLTLTPAGDALIVAETHGHLLTEIAIEAGGQNGRRRTLASFTDDVRPDGVTYGPDGRLYIACFQPSQIMRLDEDGPTLVALDRYAQILCHPTNVAFKGTTLISANLGGHHLTAIDLPGPTG